ncbi:hypothetical protein RND81_09G143300 [Saponaria officinalis]|uniref:Uncharacterized protein n=1 Tax=Saponaria officinalis TaxID=3572 RepID=A0AAW1IMC2_SAPOF
MTSRSNCEGLLCTRLEEILESDDDSRLVNLLGDHPNTDVDIINSLVNECVESGASKCLFALIRGHVCNMHPTFDHLPDNDNTTAVTALAYLAHSCPDPQLINLMLTKCRATSLANLGCTIGSVHGLPIHFLLIHLSLMVHLYFWYRSDSLLKLVFLLCYWETKPILDSLRVLVKYTDSINDIALTILKNGGLRQFTALLLIAREKVLAPFDSGLTIHHYITAEIESIPNGKLNVEQEEYKCIFMDAQSLLALFDKTGDDPSSYCSSIQKPVPIEHVVNDICNLLIKNQVNVSEFDIGLYDCYKGYDFSAINLGTLMNAYKEENFSVEPAVHSTGPDVFYRSRPYRKSMPIPKLKCLQHQLYTTGACQARKMSTSIPHTGVSPLLSYLGYIPLKFIKRIRFL